MFKFAFLKLAAAAVLAVAPPIAVAPVHGQVTQVDPNDVGEYEPGAQAQDAPPEGSGSSTYDAAPEGYEAQEQAAPEPEYQPIEQGGDLGPSPEAGLDQAPIDQNARLTSPSDSLPRDDIFSAAENVFGRGAEGLAGLIERILKDQGEPVAYIAGQEAGGAFVAGLRYGSGTMRHRTEGDSAVFWTGPTVGFDFGANANKVFVLVYNLRDRKDLYRAFPAAEGHAYAAGGFTASYMRRGDIVLIPVRLGVGLRLGVNAGYMRFSEKTRWLPF
jgi:hypothetical protein